MQFDHVDGHLRLRFEAMASRHEILVACGDEARARAALRAAHDEVRRIEAKYSRYRPDSVISRINAAAGSLERIRIDAETAALLAFSARLHELSGGLFDVTSGPLRHAWDFRAGREPTDEALERLLPLVGWPRVEWDERSVRLARRGMELDFGGIGKEYAADRAQAVLAQAGIEHGLVNLAGDLRVLDARDAGRPWTIGIQHPRVADATCAGVRLARGALATSGDYERFFITPDGRRCCHILDPRSGRPVTHWQSVSVILPSCAAAGALATIAMLLGADAPRFLREQGAAYLAIDQSGRLHRHDLDPAVLLPETRTPHAFATIP
jgi:thiamine biosynthesis lipoprotein